MHTGYADSQIYFTVKWLETCLVSWSGLLKVVCPYLVCIFLKLGTSGWHHCYNLDLEPLATWPCRGCGVSQTIFLFSEVYQRKCLKNLHWWCNFQANLFLMNSFNLTVCRCGVHTASSVYSWRFEDSMSYETGIFSAYSYTQKVNACFNWIKQRLREIRNGQFQ